MKRYLFLFFTSAALALAQVTIPWADVSKSGSNLNEIATRNFSDLQNKPTTLAGYGISDTSANLANAITDETGSAGGGVLVFNKSPTLIAPNIGFAIGNSITGNADLTLAGASSGAEIYLQQGAAGIVRITPGATGHNKLSGNTILGYGAAGSSPTGIVTVQVSDATLSPAITNEIIFANADTTVGNSSGILFTQSINRFGAGIAGIHADRTGGARVSHLALISMTGSLPTEKARLFGSGGFYVGTTPTDPGAGNFVATGSAHTLGNSAAASTITTVYGNSGVGAGAGTPVVLRIRDSSTDGGAATFGTTTPWAALDFYSDDASGWGATTRARIGAVATTNTGAQTELVTYINGSEVVRNTLMGGTRSLGTQGNDNAATGHVGEYLTATRSSASALALATGVSVDVTSVELSAGDWTVTGVVSFNNVPTGGTLTTASFSTVSATPNTTVGSYIETPTMQTASIGLSLPMPVLRVSVASNTVIYLVAKQGFTGGAAGAYGTINARRIR